VVQTSAMDCGPASLKCLLEGFGIPVSYGRLREACQTDVDGTSIDTMEEAAVQLGLSAEQQASIKAIMTAAKPQMKSAHDQMRANHLKLMQTKPDDPNYGNIVAEVAQSNAALASQRTTRAAELRAQMYAVLTPAQKTQLTALEAQWAEHPHHGPRHGPPAAQ